MLLLDVADPLRSRPFVWSLRAATVLIAIIGSVSTTAAGQTAREIRAYCARVRNHDSSGEGNNYPGMLSTVWRCANGHVYVCNLGATGAGCLKTGGIDARRRQAFDQFCRQNPNTLISNAITTGLSSEWQCNGSAPVMTSSQGVDKSGYLQGAWHRVGG